MNRELLIAGGGIAGLAVALAAAKANWSAHLFECDREFSEFGAGVQMGPNVTRCLERWGLMPALDKVAVRPECLYAHSAVSGHKLAGMSLGKTIEQRYGSPYLTIHRADLHKVLLAAAKEHPQRIHIHSGEVVSNIFNDSQNDGENNGKNNGISISTTNFSRVSGSALVIADGIWGQLRGVVVADKQAVEPTGHLAYRALLPIEAAPQRWRSAQVNLWLGPKWHVVHYPVAAGAYLNIVILIEGAAPVDITSWDHAANAQDLSRAMRGSCAALQELLASVNEAQVQWRLWPLSGRAPISGAHDMASGLAALAGDAAHPMLPYLAQGAGMAIEDASVLGRVLQECQGNAVEECLQRYAKQRWARCARVQQKSWRNAEIFHATGALRLARDMSMRLLGERLMDMPWLWGEA